MVRRAECCCHACSIEVEGEPTLNGVCHCRDCKRRTGSAFGWSVYFPDAAILDKTGEVRAYAISGANPQTRWFCAACGTTLFWKSAFRPEETGVAGGCFSPAAALEPTVTVSNDHRCGWITMPGHWRDTLGG